MKRFELPLYITLVALLSVLVFVEGTRASSLEGQVPVAPKELYKRLANSQVKLQIVDVRPEVEENYEDTHVPGAIPFPGCDLESAPERARDRVLPTVPTILVTQDGTGNVDKCRAFFTSARVLEGGMDAWVDANLPEDSGEYSPPKPGAGGGCL